MTTASDPSTRGMLTLEDLHALAASGEIDTVIVAITDVQGRLQGKLLGVDFFLNEVASHGAEGCNYLLAVDVEMNTVDGYAMSSWESGYGDMVFQPDMATLRRIPWLEGTALVVCDVLWLDGTPVVQSPRQILKRQQDRLAARELEAFSGTELEFIAFDTSYEDAQDSGYRELVPANRYNVDYSLLGSTRVEPLMRRIRNAMSGSGFYVEGTKGECNFGQHELTFRFRDALGTCDNHAIYKYGAKAIAAQEGKAITFMAKYDEREGNSCHIHLSLRGTDGSTVMAGERDHGFSELMEQFIAGVLAALPELTYFFAPNINSYKRFAKGSFAPTAIAWGFDNRTCAVRVVGHGPSLRAEIRVGGADLNPYLATAAIIAGGLHGIENALECPPLVAGNAYEAAADQLPTTLAEAAARLDRSELARAAFGDDVVDHYVNAARVELEAFEKTVTDWERVRGFERL
ncbi:glutamine synthetase family protein [Sediminivirga luteola]|uniref:Glutamine synthetase n=1 Tax=Sediminivirga luteola TaxID=1774748 RepID=A0A8J2TZ94_9MICO|nr:glutamine synthetase family protein [Sediminivirga luteola]MCI2266343.1 glutamine synthetase family protein [Sediminivirga luteola]GGA19987.1 glutamine synthetase [Sediminivirga luteola]